MPLDPSIFLQGAALKQRNNEALLNQIGQGVDNSIKIRTAKAAGLDLGKLADAAAFKFALGQELTPQDIAAVRAKSLVEGNKVQYKPDEKGNVRAITEPSAFSALYDTISNSQGVPPITAINNPDESVLAGMSSAPAPVVTPPVPGGLNIDRILQAKRNNAAAVNAPAMDIEAIMAASGDTPDPMGGPTLPAPPQGFDIGKIMPTEVPGNPNATQAGVEAAIKADVDLKKRKLEGQIKREEAAFEPPNENQGKVGTFADRLKEAESVFTNKKVESAQKNPVERGLNSVPLAGNYMVSDEMQLADQAERNFINAVLRRESGAVISPQEFENARKQYIPQPGDSQKVLDQKAANRATVKEGFIREAGPSYKSKGSNAPELVTPSGIKYRVVE